GHSWEIAIQGKKYLNPMGFVTLFGAAGVGERITSGDAKSQTYFQGFFPIKTVPSETFQTETVHSKRSTGALIGFGAEMKLTKRLLISPQIRFGFWNNRPFNQLSLKSSRNSADLLMSLRVH